MLINLDKVEREIFLRELLEVDLNGGDSEDIISDWEATAEINSIPGAKNKIMARSRALKLRLLKHAQPDNFDSTAQNMEDHSHERPNRQRSH